MISMQQQQQATARNETEFESSEQQEESSEQQPAPDGSLGSISATGTRYSLPESLHKKLGNSAA